MPYPRIQFMTTSYSPIRSNVLSGCYEFGSVDDITNDVFNSSSCFVKVNLAKGKYMASCMWRETDITTTRLKV